MRGVKMKTALYYAAVAFLLASMATGNSEPQTRFYDSRGNSLGTANPQGNGTVRYYDARGKSLGTSTTTGNTTKFYSPSGSVTGTTVAPSGGSRR